MQSRHEFNQREMGSMFQKKKKRNEPGGETMASCTYRIVISAEQLVLVDAEDHITDSKSGLSSN